MGTLIILTFFIKIFLRKLMLYGSYSINFNCISLFLFLKPFSVPVRTLCYLKKLKENWILRQKVYSHFHVSCLRPKIIIIKAYIKSQILSAVKIKRNENFMPKNAFIHSCIFYISKDIHQRLYKVTIELNILKPGRVT